MNPRPVILDGLNVPVIGYMNPRYCSECDNSDGDIPRRHASSLAGLPRRTTSPEIKKGAARTGTGFRVSGRRVDFCRQYVTCLMLGGISDAVCSWLECRDM